jgi:N-methylhydantoinase A/oxoprolinase/acetone carboxylase beta subunit
VTDSKKWLILTIPGYLDAKNFLEGRRKLVLQQAENAIANNVSDELNISVVQAALSSRDCAVDMMASLVKKTAMEAGLSPADIPLFAYGGNGPLLAAFVADKLNINRVYVSLSLGPVFSAFGTAIANVVHLYESSMDLNGDDHRQQINETLRTLKERACRDLHSEGFSAVPGDRQ